MNSSKGSPNDQAASGGDDTYRELFERSADAILIIEGDRFIECNEATVRMLRYGSRDEFLRTHPSDLSPEFQPDGRASYEKANEMMLRAFEQGSHRFEWDHRRADGEVFPVEVLLTAVHKGDRSILHVVWRDITNRKRLEGELRQAQKMEAVGKLAGGVAHDFNNLLVAILGHTELLDMELTDHPGAEEHLGEIRRASERAAALVAQLLAFSRKQVLQPRIIDLNTVMNDLNGMLKRLLGEDISIESNLAADPLPVYMDPGKLEQVVVNLATNARDAMPSGGSLIFETSRLRVTKDAAVGQTALVPGHYAALSVADTGEGIAPEALGRIFEPFFTTKGQGRGTGLGLATVYGMVKQSGGETTVHSEEGEGTVFRVFLPLRGEVPASVGPAAENEVAPARGKETILLVEDDPSVLQLVERVLTIQGYTVHSAANGGEALAMMDALELEIDLLLTDVVMPGMDGSELAQRLLVNRPDLKVLLSSGYADNALLQRGILPDDIELLEKPYAPNELLRRLRVVLDRD